MLTHRRQAGRLGRARAGEQLADEGGLAHARIADDGHVQRPLGLAADRIEVYLAQRLEPTGKIRKIGHGVLLA